VQFRAETFNLFNHTNFQNTNVSTNITSATFGKLIPGASGAADPRILQLGLKLYF